MKETRGKLLAHLSRWLNVPTRLAEFTKKMGFVGEGNVLRLKTVKSKVHPVGGPSFPVPSKATLFSPSRLQSRM